jgi:dCTP deaminase
MSIIPFIRTGDIADWTVVANDDEFTKTGGTEGHAVLIRELDHAQLAPGSPNASYDLRVGPEYKDHRDRNVGPKRELSEGEEIKLLPGAAVIVQTEEDVHFPRGIFGYIVPKVRLLQRGISNTVSKVDPGYDGRLLVTVFNLGKEKVTIQRRQPFCSISLHQVLKGGNLYNRPEQRIEVTTGRHVWRRKLRNIADTVAAYHVWPLLLVAAAELERLIVWIVRLFAHR